MSIPISGTRTRSAGVISAIRQHMKQLDLTPVKRINVRFNPFQENILETRRFLTFITAPKVIATNPYCEFKTEVVCDRSEPTVTFNLQSGDKVVLKTALLTTLNIVELYNKHISSLLPPAPPEAEPKVLKKKKKPWNKRIYIKEGSKRRGIKH